MSKGQSWFRDFLDKNYPNWETEGLHVQKTAKHANDEMPGWFIRTYVQRAWQSYCHERIKAILKKRRFLLCKDGFMRPKETLIDSEFVSNTAARTIKVVESVSSIALDKTERILLEQPEQSTREVAREQFDETINAVKKMA